MPDMDNDGQGRIHFQFACQLLDQPWGDLGPSLPALNQGSKFDEITCLGKFWGEIHLTHLQFPAAFLQELHELGVDLVNLDHPFCQIWGEGESFTLDHWMSYSFSIILCWRKAVVKF
jgi:hypothetical protein